jgi:hypothetical protein
MYHLTGDMWHIRLQGLPVGAAQSPKMRPHEIQPLILVFKFVFIFGRNASSNQPACNMRFFTYQIGIPAPVHDVIAFMVRNNPFEGHIEQLRAFFNQNTVCGDCCGDSGPNQCRNLLFNVRPQ